jgi:hypothetical protein
MNGTAYNQKSSAEQNWGNHSQSGRKYLPAIHQRTDIQNIQEAQKPKLSQNHWTSKEMGNWTKLNFFKRRNSNGQKNTWKNAHHLRP